MRTDQIESVLAVRQIFHDHKAITAIQLKRLVLRYLAVCTARSQAYNPLTRLKVQIVDDAKP